MSAIEATGSVSSSQSRARRCLPGPIDAFAIALAGVLFAAHGAWTHDTWWHLSLGEALLRTGSLPTTDTLSWTGATGRVFVNYSWLTDALLAALERLSGLGLADVAGCLAVALTLRFVYALARALGSNAAFAFVAVAAFAFSSRPLLILRPQLFTYVFFAGFFLAYVKLRAGDARAIKATPLAIVAWANLHGGFLLGLAFLGGLAALERFEAWRGDPGARGRARLLAVCALASAALACIHPSGPRNYLDTFEGSFLEPFAKNIDEWLPPDLRATPLLRVWPVAALACALALPAAPPLFEALAVLASLFLALSVLRHVPLLGIAGGPVLAAWATRGLEARALAVPASLVRLGRASERLLGACDRGPGGWAAILVAALALGAHEVAHPTPILDAPAVARHYPVAATRWIERNDLRGPLFNSYMWGGFLGWKLAPRHKVYIDSRTSIFREVFEEYLDVYAGEEDALERLDRRGVAWAVLEKDAPLVARLRAAPTWRRVYEDEVAVVFVRRGGPSDGVAAAGSGSR